ncbi:hypothetical protein [Bradyrhizobium japonicum]|uniref:hypothetical protein n=1 Tax=Bradyrhizobium japonicum TaxID=375 RepID=UPI00209CEE4C|nr:hypothetical protein [Bradyrhizobium japonicum]MCP1767263.1 alkylhydroperoxidase family enzyme [Bradyrhizobium japonicum]MCP1789402.1 alkylhydroperoxidase family enzyme [Bradyrhizobium japonicum]MCP1801901.1 alkylhydroperoxidase family enzyme [Bradyrhizobium japonicum]MCP1820212.1 alkylhydroperoxidase family enzyme [Bradyrhizobium japonicum]MCP1868280.1 alkylhydroperoxidase family enzyme [Bradyrhizobium japonicum]
MLELTDAMTRDIIVSDAIFGKLRETFDDGGIVEVMATIAAYNMVSRSTVLIDRRPRRTAAEIVCEVGGRLWL